MDNMTTLHPLQQPIVFELEGFQVPPGYGPLLFILALVNYVVTLLGNGVVVCVIVADKSLHRPMFFMVCNLVVCDLLGSTAVLPRLMVQFLTGQQKISYIPAMAQAFCVHTYGAAAQTILGAMAYDRYVAVCEPLRYVNIMTQARLHCCCALAWFIAVLFIAVLFTFHINVPLCGNVIRHVYCSNRGILSLACTPTPISNIYGLSMTWTLSTGVFLIIAFSYVRILHVSIKRGKLDSGISNKAFRTCASHLIIYVFYEISAVALILSFRFPAALRNFRHFFSILFIIVPPAVNPLVYGLLSRELRAGIMKHFSARACHRKQRGL